MEFNKQKRGGGGGGRSPNPVLTIFIKKNKGHKTLKKDCFLKLIVKKCFLLMSVEILESEGGSWVPSGNFVLVTNELMKVDGNLGVPDNI